MKNILIMLLAVFALTSSLTACFPLVAGGAVGASLVAADRRTSGTYVDDQGIEVKLARQLNRRFPAAHINITSYNRAVLMTGEFPTDQERQEAKTLVRGMPNVMKIWDYTVVAPASHLSERNNDVWITTKVRTRLLEGKGYSPKAVKVITERGVTYLVGLVTEAEGEAIVNVVRATAGVQKVVPLFEYLTEVPQQS